MEGGFYLINTSAIIWFKLNPTESTIPYLVYSHPYIYNKSKMEKQNIIEYIQSSFDHGKTQEQIYTDLLNQGWKIQDIQGIFDQIESKKQGEDIHDRTIKIVVTIGAILIGVGIFSFVAANWQEMGKIIKVLIIVAAMVSSYSAGWILKEKKGYSKTGEAFILLGSIIYGAGIFLVGQMFHMGRNWPDGFILWMIGTLVMAFAVDSFSLFYLAIPVALVAVIGVPSVFFEGHSSFLFTSLLLLILATGITFFTGFLLKNRMPKELRKIY